MRLEELNLRDPIKIGYYDPFDAFPPIRDDLVSNFPLSNLHWRYNPLKPVKSIPLLPVELEEEFPSLHAKKTLNISKPLDKIYTRLMFIKATDIETYRSQVRPLINEWLKTLVKRDNVSWTIILVSPAGKKDKKSTIIKTSVFDKLKIDFGPGGKHITPLDLPLQDNDSAAGTHEHILRIQEHYAEEITKIEVYNDFVATIKPSILSTFNRRFTESSSMIEKLNSTQSHGPVERLELFREKLRLASIFNDMRCLDESLKLYEELFTELKNLGFEETDNLEIPAFVKNIDYKDFNPETIPNDMEPYTKFCVAVESRVPIDGFAIKLGIFLKISILLQTLANFATSISISSIFVSSLLQKSVALLNDYSQSLTESTLVDQWLFAMADFHSKLPLAQKLIELDKEQAENNDGIRNVTGILEYSAELKLFKRSVLNRLASKKGFESPTACLFLSEISMEDNESGSEPSDKLELLFPEIALGLVSQKSYEDLFKGLTLSAIEDYASCERIKTIDILSIDLAMIHYRNHEFKEALEILQNSYEYFIQNGWNYVGGMLLEIFLDCIEHVEPESNEQFLKTTLKLFASLNDGDGKPHGINDYSLVKNRKERLKLFKKSVSISKRLEICHEFPLEEIFIIDVQPYIEARDDGRYFIQAKIHNKFGIQIELSSIVISLSSVNFEDENEVTFIRNNVTVDEDKSTSIELYTNKFCHDSFKIDNISVNVTDKLIFSAVIDHSLNEQADNTVIHYGEPRENKLLLSTKSLSKTLLHMFPFPGQFRIEIVSPKKINLGSFSLECIIHNGSRKVKNLSLVISALSDGLQLANDLNRYNFEEIEGNDHVNLQFDCNTERKFVEIQAICQYEIDGEIFEYRLRNSHDLNLKISVSVQDIFKPSSIYSKFQIGCVNPQFPVRVNKCDYSCSQGKYDVTNSNTISKDNMSIIVSGEQPAYLFYRIVPTTDEFKSSDILDFKIQYSDLQKECEDILQGVLRSELVKRGKEKYYFLLSPLVIGLQFDLNKYGVGKSICASNLAYYSTLMNDKIAEYIPPEHGSDLIDILSSLFKNDRLINPEGVNVAADECELYIPVSVPYLNILHHTSFLLEEKSDFVVGQPINTKLVVNSSSKWSDSSSDVIIASSSPRQKSKRETNFELTILNDEDWLISGLKRQNFCVRESETTSEINLCLIPLNAGELILPKIAIKAIDNESCTADLVQENGFETVLVIPELENVTFAF